MAPQKKAAAQEEEASIADLCRLIRGPSEQLACMNAKMNKIEAEVQKVDRVENEVKNVKTLMESLREENKELKSLIKQKDEQLSDMQSTVNDLETRLNSLEQHHRGWGARVLNIPLSEEEEGSTQLTVQKVYNLALRPILEGAASTGKIKEVPPAEQVLEMAHVLPGKPGQPKPIIMHFFNRQVRNLCFQLKKDFAARETPRGASGREGGGAETRRRGGEQQVNGGGGHEGPGRYRYPLYDDLTKANLAKLRAISQDSRVQACWSVNGQIRFKLKDSNVVKKLNSVLEPLDDILK